PTAVSQCVPQCQPSCNPQCTQQYHSYAQPAAITFCPQQNSCACGSGYTQCMQGICCLRKRHRVARTLRMNDAVEDEPIKTTSETPKEEEKVETTKSPKEESRQ
uniref:Uncharacterized protein n=1 Tax=Panagrolaimus sp. PS1159 TaxID=55785 RepID=A0AC35GGV8_9BILA